MWQKETALISQEPQDWLVFFSLLSCLRHALALSKLINITVDDSVSDGDKHQLRYLPDEIYWSTQDCVGCLAKPDAAMAFNETWHDTTFSPSISSRAIPRSVSFNFTGND